jgi:hypothetical protein
MGFSFASVLLSYFLIAGGTFGTALLAGRFGIRSEYLGYIILAVGGFLGGMVAARASRGSTIIEPAIGAVVLLASLIGLGAAVSGGDAQRALLLPSTMKAIALTAAASGGGGIGGAFLAEKLMGDEPPRYASWILFVAIAAFGAGVLGSTFGTVLGRGDSGPLLGMLALFCFILGAATGASATERPLGAAFLGSAIGIGGFFYLTILLFMALFNTKESAPQSIPSEVYAGMAIMAVGAGIVTLIGAAIGWAAVGKKA